MQSSLLLSMMNLYSDYLLSSATVQTKRILCWFSVLEFTNNVKYAGDGKFIQVSLCEKHYQHRTWLDRVIEKIKRCSFFASQGRNMPCVTMLNLVSLGQRLWAIVGVKKLGDAWPCAVKMETLTRPGLVAL